MSKKKNADPPFPMVKDGGAAFPRPYTEYGDGPIQYSAHEQSSMSLRQWFAGQALAGLLANPRTNDWSAVTFRCHAFGHADEMLKEKE